MTTTPEAGKMIYDKLFKAREQAHEHMMKQWREYCAAKQLFVDLDRQCGEDFRRQFMGDTKQ